MDKGTQQRLRRTQMLRRVSCKKTGMRIGPHQRVEVTRAGLLEDVVMTGGTLVIKAEGVVKGCEVFKGKVEVKPRGVCYGAVLHKEASLVISNAGHARNVTKEHGAKVFAFPGSEYESATRH